MFALVGLRGKESERDFFLLVGFPSCLPVINPLVGIRIRAGVRVIVLMVFAAVFLYFPD